MRQNRKGYTLIEVMAVISLIVILAAMLLPAINSVRANARIASVRMEISQFESAIADFRLKFGSDPPSQITIYESWSAGWDIDSSSRAKIRGLWPKFDFGQTSGLTRDFNKDGDTDDFYLLKGDQCLTFFLGGIFDSVKGFRGFSSNPSNPFVAPDSVGVGPFFNFDIGRVAYSFGVDYQYFDSGTFQGDCSPIFPVFLDGIPGQTRPYVYVSSNDGLGYNDSASNLNSDANTFPATAERPDGFRAYRMESGEYWKPRGYQIISPGWDHLYGEGGVYNPKAPTKLPPTDPLNPRVMEWDNITNFTSGMLDP